MPAWLTSIGMKIAGIAAVAMLIGGLLLDNAKLRADAKASASQVVANTAQCKLDAQSAAANVSIHTAQEVAAQQAADNAAYGVLVQQKAGQSATDVVSENAIDADAAIPANDPPISAVFAHYRATLVAGQ